MSSVPTTPPGKSRFRVILTRVLQVFIVLCLIDGFVDIAYPILKAAKGSLTTHMPPRQFGYPLPIAEEDYVLPSDAARRREPGISGIAGEYHSPRYNVSADGMRSNDQPAPENAHGYGLLLGSSVGFGAGVADNRSLAAQLERALNDVRVENYAGLAQTIPENTMRWYDVQTRKGKPEFVIIAGVNFQLFRTCLEDPPPLEKQEHRNVLLYLGGRLIGSQSAQQDQHKLICNSSHELDLAVRSSIMAVENAVAFARKQGIPFYIVYLPTPYDRNANVQHLITLADFRSTLEVMRTMHERYHTELMKLGLPEVIDLSGAFPPANLYFLDPAGHLSPEGNRIIAERLAELLRNRMKQ